MENVTEAPAEVRRYIGSVGEVPLAGNSSSLGSEGVRLLDPALIDPNPAQPRREFQADELQHLAASIGRDGLLQPVVVVPQPEEPGRFHLIAGERRLRASKLAGLEAIPALVRTRATHDLLRLALIENIQRADLNIVEEAMAYESMIRDLELTQDECAQQVGKERSTVTNALRILTLPRLVQGDLCAGRLTMGHAKALLSLTGEATVLKVRSLVVQKGLSVRRTEQLCRQINDGALAAAGAATEPVVDPDIEYIADTLRSFLRTKVKIAGSAQRGKIEISYFSTAELERVLGMIHNGV